MRQDAANAKTQVLNKWMGTWHHKAGYVALLGGLGAAQGKWYEGSTYQNWGDELSDCSVDQAKGLCDYIFYQF